MKRFALVLALFSTPACAAAQGRSTPPDTKTIVLLVRHAEKASETENDPALSERGRARAAALAEALRGARITGAIVSERRRTHETAAPSIGSIVPDTVSIRGGAAAHARAVAERIRSRHAGGIVLVAGHSNTIPAIMTALGAGPLPDICDAAYANLYIMVLDAGTEPRVIETKFGPPDPAGADDCPGMRAP